LTKELRESLRTAARPALKKEFRDFREVDGGAAQGGAWISGRRGKLKRR
jgi:hypothetical protein